MEERALQDRRRGSAWGQVAVHDGTLNFFAEGVPPGTRFTIGTTTATASDDGDAQLDATAQSLYGALPLGAIEMPTLEGATLKVEAPGANALEVPLPPIRVSFVGNVLLEVTRGPVLFASEDPRDARLTNVVFDATAQTPVVVGSRPGTLRDVDAVAVSTLEPPARPGSARATSRREVRRSRPSSSSSPTPRSRFTIAARASRSRPGASIRSRIARSRS